MTPETKVKTKLKKVFSSNDIFYMPISDRYHVGYPDVLAITSSGEFGFVEVKSEDGVLSPMQKEFMRKMIKLNVPYIVAYSQGKNLWLKRMLSDGAVLERLTTSNKSESVSASLKRVFAKSNDAAKR